MKFEAITIKDIAKALGLYTSTVSRALRDSYEIRTETRRLVLEYAEKFDDRPNPIAQSLQEKRKKDWPVTKRLWPTTLSLSMKPWSNTVGMGD